MVGGIANALSGYQNAAKRIEVSANNIANQFSTVKTDGGESSKKPYQPAVVISVSQQEGGVQTEVQPREPATVKRFDPQNPAADESGIADVPNVDVGEEMVNQIIASYDAKANLKAIKIENDLMQQTLDIFS
jgi:flagellar basal-body rod protein FlgC